MKLCIGVFSLACALGLTPAEALEPTHQNPAMAQSSLAFAGESRQPIASSDRMIVSDADGAFGWQGNALWQGLEFCSAAQQQLMTLAEGRGAGSERQVANHKRLADLFHKAAADRIVADRGVSIDEAWKVVGPDNTYWFSHWSGRDFEQHEPQAIQASCGLFYSLTRAGG